MMPEIANTKNCKVVKVVYNDGDFDIGTPNIGQNPTWLYYPEKLYQPTLASLLGLPDTDESARQEVLSAIKNNIIIRPV